MSTATLTADVNATLESLVAEAKRALRDKRFARATRCLNLARAALKKAPQTKLKLARSKWNATLDCYADDVECGKKRRNAASREAANAPKKPAAKAPVKKSPPKKAATKPAAQPTGPLAKPSAKLTPSEQDAIIRAINATFTAIAADLAAVSPKGVIRGTDAREAVADADRMRMYGKNDLAVEKFYSLPMHAQDSLLRKALPARSYE